MSDRPDNQLFDLEHYALKGMEYGRLTGLSIASHAISDSFLLMHVGVGCKNKAVAHLMVHDAAEDANLREGWTEVGDRDLILGSSTRVAPYMRSWMKRQSPSVLFMTSVTFIDLAGEDLLDHIDKAQKDIPAPVLFVSTTGTEGDLYEGYAKGLEALLGQMNWEQEATKPTHATLLGYFFDRYEEDHSANIHHIGSLMSHIGVPLGTTLLSGKSFEDMMKAPESGILIELPYTRPIRKKMKRTLKGRTTHTLDLPMGLRGTRRWLQEIARIAGTWSPKVEQKIERIEAKTRKKIGPMLDRWRGMKVAVFADPAHGAGLTSLLLELGLHPVLIGIKGSTLGGEDSFREVLEADGNPLPDDSQVLENPSIWKIQESLKALLKDGQIDGVFGNATDLNALSSIPAEHFLAGTSEPQGPFILETGFPCQDNHVFYPMPFMGYRGVEAWVQRIISAPRLWNAGRKPHFPNF